MKSHFEWKVNTSDYSFEVREPLGQDLGQYPDGNIPEVEIGQYVLDLFYLTNLKKIAKESHELNPEDSNWLALNLWNDRAQVVFKQVSAIIHTIQPLFTGANRDDIDKYDYFEIIQANKRGKKSSITQELQTPYKERYQIYHCLSTSFLTINQTLQSTIDKKEHFVEFLGKSLNTLEQQVTQFCTEKSIADILKELGTEDVPSKMRKHYVKGSGCVSLTDIYCDLKTTEIVSFSGHFLAGQTNWLTNEFQQLQQTSRFKNSKIIFNCNKVRYYFFDNQFTTPDIIAKSQNLITVFNSSGNIKRLFSCCERKTHPEMDNFPIEKYEMYVKYEPCDLCIKEVNEYLKHHNGKLICGLQNKMYTGDIPVLSQSEQNFREIQAYL